MAAVEELKAEIERYFDTIEGPEVDLRTIDQISDVQMCRCAVCVIEGEAS